MVTAPTALVRTLGHWLPLHGASASASASVSTSAASATGMDFAERLSLWIGPVEAITLQAAHQALRKITTPASARTPGATPVASPASNREPLPHAAALADDVQRVRAALGAAIARDPLPPAVPGASHAELARDAAFATYLQQHQALQRHMERLVEPLRDHLRQALARASAPLRQLAALDAVLAQTLAARQEQLLAATGPLLERRYEQLRQAHRDARQAAGLDESEDNPARWREPGAWLHRFEADWRQCLRDELELRLEPVLGLVSALCPPIAGQAPLTPKDMQRTQRERPGGHDGHDQHDRHAQHADQKT